MREPEGWSQKDRLMPIDSFGCTSTRPRPSGERRSSGMALPTCCDNWVGGKWIFKNSTRGGRTHRTLESDALRGIVGEKKKVKKLQESWKSKKNRKKKKHQLDASGCCKKFVFFASLVLLSDYVTKGQRPCALCQLQCRDIESILSPCLQKFIYPKALNMPWKIATSIIVMSRTGYSFGIISHICCKLARPSTEHRHQVILCVLKWTSAMYSNPFSWLIPFKNRICQKPNKYFPLEIM